MKKDDKLVAETLQEDRLIHIGLSKIQQSRAKEFEQARDKHAECPEMIAILEETQKQYKKIQMIRHPTKRFVEQVDRRLALLRAQFNHHVRSCSK